jgi:hypothetical protein
MVERRVCLSLIPSHVFRSVSYNTSVKQAVRTGCDVSLSCLHVYKVLLSPSRNTIANILA